MRFYYKYQDAGVCVCMLACEYKAKIKYLASRVQALNIRQI